MACSGLRADLWSETSSVYISIYINIDSEELVRAIRSRILTLSMYSLTGFEVTVDNVNMRPRIAFMSCSELKVRWSDMCRKGKSLKSRVF